MLHLANRYYLDYALTDADRKPAGGATAAQDAYPTALDDEISAIFLISSLLHLRLHRILADEPYRDDFMRMNGDLEPVGAAQ